MRSLKFILKLLKCYRLGSRLKQYHLRGASVKSELHHQIVIVTIIVMIIIIIIPFDDRQQPNDEIQLP